ncbi:MAG: ATP-binding protein [Candidatus Nitrosotenuis sp.]
MPDQSPYFFIKEFSNEELMKILVAKIKELKESKADVESLNMKLQDNMAKLEELQQEIIQQRDNLKEEVRHKDEELLKAERLSAIGQLSARIAHDLRNPLNVISNTSKILRVKLEKHLDEKSSEQWARLDRAISRLSHQLEDVLDYVRMPKLKREKYSLSLICHDVIERIQMPSNISFHPPLKDATVFCDPEKMEIVFVNLMVNAIQAIGKDDGDISIEIFDDREDDSFVLINVSDSGPGVPQEIQDKIFEPLFTTKQVGTGLGLSSCKSIIMQHGGTISVQSSGKGATFTIRIPKNSDWDSMEARTNSVLASFS